MSILEDLLRAYSFSAYKHQKQRRKGEGNIPYINHPINVANTLAQTVGAKDIPLLIAAVLHDTLEDTKTTKDELLELFGDEVLSLVIEVTDDMTLSKSKRRMLQVEKAPGLSDKAKLIKIADKKCNISDIINTRFYMTKKQKIDYVRWAKDVIDQCMGINLKLDDEFIKTVQSAEMKLGTSF